MADSFKITDGTTSYELQYAAGSQENYKLQYGSRVSVAEPEVLVHQPDFGETQPIRAVDRDREVYLTMNVTGTDWDEVFDNITRIKRMVDGAHSQALRYWTTGDVDRVVLRVQKNGSTNYTDLPIKWGFVDDSEAYHTQIQTVIGWKIVVMLVVAPYGEGAPITLRNDLPSSPHAIEDSNSDGLADGWNTTSGGGSLTTVVSTGNWLIGGKSQEAQVDDSNRQGVTTDFVTCSASTDVAAKIYIGASISGDPVTIILQDSGSNTLQSKEFDPANPSGYHARFASQGSGSLQYFYEYRLSGTTTGTNVRLVIQREAADASTAFSFFVDGAYIQLDTTTIPDAWCSTSAVENQYKPTSSDEARINYIDIWGVPGDAPALADHFITPQGGAGDTSQSGFEYIIGRDVRLDSAAFATHFVDSSSITISTGGSTVTDSSRVGGNYKRYTSAGTDATASCVVGSTAAKVRKFLAIPRKVYAVVDASDDFTITPDPQTTTRAITFEGGGFSGDTGGLDDWKVIQLGTIPAQVVPANVDITSFEFKCILSTASSETLDLDCLYFVPLEEHIIGRGINGSNSQGTLRYIDADKMDFYHDDFYKAHPFVGGLWHLHPKAVNRYVYILHFAEGSASVDNHDPDFGHETELTVVPRSRHLLGVI
jgi:hypothetical protein